MTPLIASVSSARGFGFGRLMDSWSPEGAFDSLATATVPAGGLSTVTFAGIPNTYKHLQVRVIARNTATSGATSNDLSWRVNGDSGSNYIRHRLFGTGSAVGSSASPASVTYASSELGIVPSDSYLSGVYCAAVIDVFDYSNTSKFKTFKLLGGIDGNTNDTNSRIGFNSNLWMSTNAITSLTFFVGTGSPDNFKQHSQFALYGIK